MFTEKDYDDFLDEVDPDDIKRLLELGSNQYATGKLMNLHEEAKCVLDYFGRQ